MKIGILLPSLLTLKKNEDRIFAPKGLYSELLDRLVEKGHTVFAFTASDFVTKATVIGGNKQLEESIPKSIEDIWSMSESSSYGTTYANHEYELDLTAKAYTFAQANALDLIHSFSFFAAHFFAEVTKIPSLFTIHDHVFPENTFEYFRYTQFSHHNYVAISDRQKSIYEQEYGLNFTGRIYNGIRIPKIKKEISHSDYCVYMGRIIPEKGVDDAIQAAKMQKINLKIASSTYDRQSNYFKKVIRPLIDNNQIEDVGMVAGNEKFELLAGAKFFILPVKFEESFGMVLIESMSVGTPVVAYAMGAIPEIVKDAKTGLIVNMNSANIRGDWVTKSCGVEGLCEAVKAIQTIESDQYVVMSNMCRELVSKSFSIDLMVSNYEKIYEKIIKTSPLHHRSKYMI